MLIAIAAVIVGLALLVWSADKFVDGAAATAAHFGMPALLIGMVVIGFGTSAPELVVSAIASLQGNPALALGNAYGSNITNIALILGLTALLAPISMNSQVLKRELPLLLMVTLISVYPLWDYSISRAEAWFLLAVFTIYMSWSVIEGSRNPQDAMSGEFEQEVASKRMPIQRAVLWLLIGLVLLIISSRLLVWGAVHIAQLLGISDLVIGLTVVAIGTSLPELASALAAIRKNEHDLAIGNVIGSNVFNTLAVVGLAGAIHPISLEPLVLSRDWVVMLVLTLLLLLFGLRRNRPGRINRWHGGIFLACFIGYTLYLFSTVKAGL